MVQVSRKLVNHRLLAQHSQTFSCAARSSVIVLPTLLASSLHIWKIHLEEFEWLDPNNDLLDEHEINRMKRFVFGIHAKRFATARKVLRCVLGAYCSIHPRELIFKEGPFGKPYLFSGSKVMFNLSHTGDSAAIAIAKHVEVGVDIEIIKPRNFEGLAQHGFSSDEIASLLTVPATQRAHAFYQIWCQKEAFIKQCGRGLNYPLKTFSVTLTSEGRVQSASEETKQLTLKCFLFKEGVMGAYCAPHHLSQLIFLEPEQTRQLVQEVL